MNHLHHGVVLGLGANVEIAGIEPATNIEAGNVFTGFVRCVGCWPLCIHVEVGMVYRRLQGIVHVRFPVPDTVCLVYEHVVHLHGHENIECRLPCIIVYVGSNAERGCLFIINPNAIHAFFFYFRKIECFITVAQIIAPIFESCRFYNLCLTFFRNPDQFCCFFAGIVFVEFNDGFFRLIGVVTELRVCNYRFAYPVFDCIGRNFPLNYIACFVFGN